MHTRTLNMCPSMQYVGRYRASGLAGDCAGAIAYGRLDERFVAMDWCLSGMAVRELLPLFTCLFHSFLLTIIAIPSLSEDDIDFTGTDTAIRQPDLLHGVQRAK